MTEFIFWSVLLLIFYTYFGYLLLLFVIALFFKKKIKKNDIYPKVSFIIAAYNEDANIQTKLDNTLALDYPKDKIEIIVVSDCSTDNTDKIVQGYHNREVRLVRQKVRSGKTEAQNSAVRYANGEILLFSDATTIYSEKALKKIVRNFSDQNVGCVEGKLLYVNDKRKASAVERGLFTKIETLIRIKESEIGSVLGVSGCVYAVKKVLYKEMHKSLVSDLGISFIIVSQGYRVVFEKEAVVYEEASLSLSEEFLRNIRTVCQGWASLMILKKDIVNMFKPESFNFFLVQIISHKIFRWLSPFFLIAFFLVNLCLLNKGQVYKFIFMGQLIFYLLSLMCVVLDKFKLRSFKLISSIGYFSMYNLACIFGLVGFIKGETNATWKTLR